jgi:hypothetical protein
MFHLKPNPRPPSHVGRDTPDHAVDSSAIVDHAGQLLVDLLVEPLQERDRLEVLAAAVHVRAPGAVGATVVEVEHRGDRVDAQPVDVVLVSQNSALAIRKFATSVRPKS